MQDLENLNIVSNNRKALQNQTNFYLFKVNNENSGTKCKICPKLTIKTPEPRHRRRYGAFIVNCEHISHFFWYFHCCLLDKCQLFSNFYSGIEFKNERTLGFSFQPPHPAPSER